MSDVPVTPAGGAPSSATPSAPRQEVPINPNPVSPPNPIGSQAPPAPEGDLEGSKHRPKSRAETVRDSVQEAFKRAEEKTGKPAQPKARPAEAKAGHNNPPEETPKLNLKKRPDDQAPPEQPRDKGRFAPRQDVNGEQQSNAVNSGQPGQPGQPDQPGQPHKRLPPHAPYSEPIPRMAESAKRDWADTPETVRGDIHRLNSEVGKAIQHYQGVAQAFKPIARFHQMAQEHGTTLEQALTNYVGIETKLREDPIAGLDMIINNLNLKDPQTQQPIGLRDIAYYVLNRSPEQLQQVQQGNMQSAAQQQIGALYQEVNGLKRALQQWQNAQQFTHVRSAVDHFAETHPRLDELGALIENEIKLGFDIETAYRRAELLQPATHAAQTRTTSAQTRPTDKSIYGAPDVAPSNGASRRPKDPSPNPRAAVQNALHRLNGTH